VNFRAGHTLDLKMSVKVVDSELRTESGVAAEEHTALVGLDKFQRMNPTVFGVSVFFTHTHTHTMYVDIYLIDSNTEHGKHICIFALNYSIFIVLDRTTCVCFCDFMCYCCHNNDM